MVSKQLIVLKRNKAIFKGSDRENLRVYRLTAKDYQP